MSRHFSRLGPHKNDPLEIHGKTKEGVINKISLKDGEELNKNLHH